MTRRPTILVVDDEPALRELMRVTLGRGFEFVEAADADVALAVARTRRPDLVLLDVMLPGRSGLDVLRELRRDPDLDSIPVIVVSAWQSQQDQVEALDAGADAFVGKPFLVDELSAVVRALVGRAA